jgi:hypothetical protein
MGTRSLTRVIENGKTLVTLYRQMGGYPTGHGKDLAKFLKPMKLINGISGNETGKIANGAGCLAAQLIAYFKKDVGGFYIVPSKKGSDHDQEFEYDIVISGDYDKHDFRVNAYSFHGKRKLLFSVPPSGMDLAIKLYAKAQENE